LSVPIEQWICPCTKAPQATIGRYDCATSSSTRRLVGLADQDEAVHAVGVDHPDQPVLAIGNDARQDEIEAAFGQFVGQVTDQRHEERVGDMLAALVPKGMMTPIAPRRRVRRLRATELGLNPCSSASLRIRSAVLVLTTVLARERARDRRGRDTGDAREIVNRPDLVSHRSSLHRSATGRCCSRLLHSWPGQRPDQALGQAGRSPRCFAARACRGRLGASVPQAQDRQQHREDRAQAHAVFDAPGEIADGAHRQRRQHRPTQVKNSRNPAIEPCRFLSKQLMPVELMVG
jgi:hypothetical protein